MLFFICEKLYVFMNIILNKNIFKKIKILYKIS